MHSFTITFVQSTRDVALLEDLTAMDVGGTELTWILFIAILKQQGLAHLMFYFLGEI